MGKCSKSRKDKFRYLPQSIVDFILIEQPIWMLLELAFCPPKGASVVFLQHYKFTNNLVAEVAITSGPLEKLEFRTDCILSRGPHPLIFFCVRHFLYILVGSENWIYAYLSFLFLNQPGLQPLCASVGHDSQLLFL